MSLRKKSVITAITAEIATTAKITTPNASSIGHHGPMWRRVRRRTMAPRRPALFPGQYALALLSGLLLLASIGLVMWAVFG